ncbi:MAG: TonB-dependent receptor [Gammaproteobacteria bacterium]|nr:TonB-dependent receptor [Gammaproteobacteria bacterium]
MKNNRFVKTKLATSLSLALGAFTAPTVLAQETDAEKDVEVIQVKGIRGSQLASINEKKFADGVVDGISAEDIGKLPDVTIADSLQRITGVQIQRSAGEGSTVNIRGLPQVRTLLNGEQMLTAGNIGSAQPNLSDIPSQLVKGVSVYKSTDLTNKRSGLTGTIDLKTWRPFDLDEGFTSQGALELGNGAETQENDLSANGLINWNNGNIGFLISAATSEANLGNNFAGTGGDIFPANDWGGYGEGADEFLAPHGFESFNRAIERKRDAINLAFQADLGNGLTFTAEAFHTDMVEHDRKVGLNISNRWQTLNWLTPTDSTDLGIARDNWSGGNWVSTQEYDVDALWVNSFTVNRTRESKSTHVNLELNYEGDNLSVKGRLINDKAEFLSMNGQSQGDLSNWGDDNFFQLNPFYPASIADDYDSSRLSDTVGENGGRFIEPNPLGYGENPQLHLDLSGSDHRWTGFDRQIQGGLGDGKTLADYMANVGSYAIGAFSSENNQENKAENTIASLDAEYLFDDYPLGFITKVEGGVRYSKRENDISNFHLFSDFYAGNGASSADGCAAQWKAIDVVMNNPQCTAGENVDGVFQAYTVNRPTSLDEFNNTVFITDLGSGTSGIPGFWAADPKDYDDVTSFHEKVFGGANRVHKPGNSYLVDLEETSAYFDVSFELEDINVKGTFGARYISTEISTTQNLTGEVQAYGDTNLDIGDYTSSSDYTDVLPALNLSYAPTQDIIIRFSASKNMMAHDLGTYGGGLTINTVSCTDPTIVGGRCVSGANEGGNPQLEPWRTTNLDLSAEYYYGSESMFHVAAFKVDIESFTAGGERRDSFPDSDGVIRREVPVTTVVLGEGGVISGLEAGSKFAFSDFMSGPLENFGIDTNYTWAPSDSNDTDPAGNDLPFVDNSEHQFNFSTWYQDDKFQARIAYNHRSERYTGSQGGVPGYQNSIGYLDAQITYSYSENISIYLNGSNITGEQETYYLDWGTGPTQFWQLNEFEARYTIGVRAKL